MSARIGVGGIFIECNHFTAQFADRAAFERSEWLAGDALLAHHEKRTRHSAAVMFNEISYAMTLAGRPGWAAWAASGPAAATSSRASRTATAVGLVGRRA